MDQWISVRRFVLAEGHSKRSACRHFGISWRVMEKMLASPEPPGYRMRAPRPRPKLDAVLPIIHRILTEDRVAPRKQRHTARRIFDRLRAEHGYTGGYTVVKDAVRAWRNVHQETFVPLTHAPGEAQVDFGEAQAQVGGELMKVCLFVMSLPYSDAVFVAGYPRECTEAFCDGHVRALEFFGGVPRVIRYDNTRIAVSKVMGGLGGRERVLTDAFLRLQSHYLFGHEFCRVRRANEKGHVENLIGYTRRNFLVPVPSVTDIAALNAMLRDRCERELDRTVRGRVQSKGERLAEDRAALRPMPGGGAFEARRVQPARANSLSLVSFDRHRYSVPVQFAHRELTVVGTIEEVRILRRDRVIATHPRDWETRESRTHFDPVHYLALLERKPGALDTARPLEDWPLPVCFGILRRQMEGHWPDGTRRFIRVLRLLERHTLGELTGAVRWALEHGCVDEDAIRLVAQGRAERATPVFSLDGRAHLRAVRVAAPDLAAYAALTATPACAIGGAA